jgi:Putative Actinobacterial Holin-X, holin superfamily III
MMSVIGATSRRCVKRRFRERGGDLTASVSTLLRKEVELARAETSKNVNQALVAAGSIAAGGILALAALIVLLQALVIALTELGLAPALSALIVGGIIAIVAFALIYKVMADLKASSLARTRSWSGKASCASDTLCAASSGHGAAAGCGWPGSW